MTSPVFLIGGGRDPAGVRASHEPFVAACADGEILVVCEDDAERWTGALASAGAARVRARALDDFVLDDLDGAAGVYVAGGLTPAYAAALVPTGLGARVRERRLPYAGYSAGAALAATRALVGGWRLDGRAVCDEDASEDLDELTVVDGLGLVPLTVEVHATQWGTLTRLVHAVAGGLTGTGVAVDEHTCVEVRGSELTLHGLGSAYRVGVGTLHVLTV